MKNLLNFILVVVCGAVFSFLTSKLLFPPKTLYNYNIVSRFDGINSIFLMPLFFLLGSLITYLLLLWLKQNEIKHKIFKAGLSVLIIVLLLLKISLSFPQKQPVFPNEGSMAIRNEWAMRNLNPYYSIAIEKIKKTEAIVNDVGQILAIAPSAHSENGEYDGWATFNLEISGTSGNGLCKVVYRDISGKPPIFSEIIWEFNGKVNDFSPSKEDFNKAMFGANL